MDTCQHGYLRPTCPACGHDRPVKTYERFAPQRTRQEDADAEWEMWKPGMKFDLNIDGIADKVYRSGVDSSIRDGNLRRG